MADHLLFSEVISNLTGEEEAWLRSQLVHVVVVNGREYPSTEMPEYLGRQDVEWWGYRGWRDDLEYSFQEEGELGFGYRFQDDGCGRHLSFFAANHGEPEQVAHLVQKFLCRFRPHEYWTLSYARTFPEFGGGAILVTVGEIVHQHSRNYLDAVVGLFQEGKDSGRHVPRLMVLAKELGLTSADLEQVVADAALAEVAETHWCVEDHVEYLVSRCGAEKTEKMFWTLVQARPTHPPHERDTMKSVNACLLSASEARNRLVEFWTAYLCDDRDNVAEMLRTNDTWQVPTFGPNTSDEQVAEQFADLDLAEKYREKHKADMVLIQVSQKPPQQFTIVGEWESSGNEPSADAPISRCLVLDHRELVEMLRRSWKKQFQTKGDALVDQLLDGDVRLPVLPELGTSSLAVYLAANLASLGGLAAFSLPAVDHCFLRWEKSLTVYRLREPQTHDG